MVTNQDWWLTSLMSATQKEEIKREDCGLRVASSKNTKTLSEKYLKQKKKKKRAKSMAQMLEHLSSKHEALRSNTSTTKRNNELGTSIILATWEAEIRRIKVQG
jgi:Skp family chaperone for outer membrane proteins